MGVNVKSEVKFHLSGEIGLGPSLDATVTGTTTEPVVKIVQSAAYNDEDDDRITLSGRDKIEKLHRFLGEVLNAEAA